MKQVVINIWSKLVWFNPDIYLFTKNGIVQPTEQDHSDKEDDCGNVGLEHKIEFKAISI